MGRRMDIDSIRLREEIFHQMKALQAMKEMAALYGFDISVPASNAREAVQWLYFAYLAAVKEQTERPWPGRIANFLDIYIERDRVVELIDETGRS